MIPNTSRNLRPIKNKCVLLIGGAGFIGRHLARILQSHNTVRILDNFSRENEPSSSLLRGCEILRGDVLDFETLTTAIAGVDLVIHLAAISGIHTVTRKPLRTMEVNLIGAYNALRAAAAAEVDRFVFSSTSEVYGPRVYLGKENDMTAQGPVSEPRWGYSVSKLAGEFLAHAFLLERGLKTTSLRYFNVYGPGQVGEGAVHNFVVAALKGDALQIFGSGLQIRAWTYVDDIVDGILLATASENAVGKVYNIGNPATACTIIALANMIVELASSNSRIEFVPLKLADVDLRVPDISLARRELGFRPRVSLEDGLRRTFRFYKELRNI